LAHHRLKKATVATATTKMAAAVDGRVSIDLSPLLLYSAGLSAAATSVLARDGRLNAAPLSFIASCSTPTPAEQLSIIRE
jgi:hypothetical protein